MGKRAMPSVGAIRQKPSGAELRQKATRDRLWPGADGWVWNPRDESVKGFATISRLMPWIFVLIGKLAEKTGRGGNPFRVYLELLCRDWYRLGYVAITDELDHAYAAGYESDRGQRTWEDHVKKLAELGFIKIAPQGKRKLAHILLMDPLAVAHWYYKKGDAPEEWWNSFKERADAIGAEIPEPVDPKDPPAVISRPTPKPPGYDDDDEE